MNIKPNIQNLNNLSMGSYSAGLLALGEKPKKTDKSQTDQIDDMNDNILKIVIHKSPTRSFTIHYLNLLQQNGIFSVSGHLLIKQSRPIREEIHLLMLTNLFCLRTLLSHLSFYPFRLIYLSYA